VNSPDLQGGVLPGVGSREGNPLPPTAKGAGRDETTAQAALRLLMMMVGSAGLAADRSLFWTILGSCAKQGQALPKLDPKPRVRSLSELEPGSTCNHEPNA